MNAKHGVSASIAVAAMAAAWLANHWRQNTSARQECLNQQCYQRALDTFEGEGGLVIT